MRYEHLSCPRRPYEVLARTGHGLSGGHSVYRKTGEGIVVRHSLQTDEDDGTSSVTTASNPNLQDAVILLCDGQWVPFFCDAVDAGYCSESNQEEIFPSQGLLQPRSHC